jgi:hypothetical protein
MFRNPLGDFHLMSSACGDTDSSPLIDAGDPFIRDKVLDCAWGLGTYHSDIGPYGGGDTNQSRIEEDEHYGINESFFLSPNFPNPFNSSTTIRYDLPRASDVRVEIYDILGRKTELLFSGPQEAGTHAIVWESKNSPSGIYFYSIKACDTSHSRGCLLLK